MQPHSFAINILGRANNVGPVAKVASRIASDFTSYLGYQYIVFAYSLVRYSSWLLIVITSVLPYTTSVSIIVLRDPLRFFFSIGSDPT